MPDTVIIREARAEDVPSLNQMYTSLMAGGPVVVKAERIDEALHNPWNFIFVATKDDIVAATASLGICLNGAFSNSYYGVIENFYVREGYRRRGIATALLSFIEGLCKERGCTKIMALSAMHRIEAHLILQRMGFSSETAKGFKKYLIGNADP